MPEGTSAGTVFAMTSDNNPKTLAELANDEDVRSHVAKNPATPAEILTELAEHTAEWVRWSVAENPSTPKRFSRN